MSVWLKSWRTITWVLVSPKPKALVHPTPAQGPWHCIDSGFTPTAPILRPQGKDLRVLSPALTQTKDLRVLSPAITPTKDLRVSSPAITNLGKRSFLQGNSRFPNQERPRNIGPPFKPNRHLGVLLAAFPSVKQRLPAD